jgi:hypothetical protein
VGLCAAAHLADQGTRTNRHAITFDSSSMRKSALGDLNLIGLPTEHPNA